MESFATALEKAPRQGGDGQATAAQQQRYGRNRQMVTAGVGVAGRAPRDPALHGDGHLYG